MIALVATVDGTFAIDLEDGTVLPADAFTPAPAPALTPSVQPAPTVTPLPVKPLR